MLILGPESVPAQTPADTTRGKARSLNPIVVTATRSPAPATTSAYDVISGADLRARGFTQIADALREVPGLHLVQTGSFGGLTSLYLRGGESGYTRVLVDGIPVNDPGGDLDFAWLGTEDVDRIEIVRGPVSVLYGSDAATGVIQIFTRRTREPSLHFASTAGSYGTRDLAGSAVDADSTHSSALSLHRSSTNGIHAFNSGYRRTDATASLWSAQTLGFETHILAKYSDGVVHIPTNGVGQVVDHNAFQADQRFVGGLTANRHLAQYALSVALSLSQLDGGFNNAQDGPADTLGFFAFREEDHIARRSTESTVQRQFAAGIVTAAVGVEDELQHALNESNSQFGASHGDFDAYRSNRHLFVSGNGESTIGSWLASARLDDNSAFGTFATYRIGASRSMGVVRLRSSAGSAFREPTFTENFATGFATGNHDLAPEHIVSAEFGGDLAMQGLVVSSTAFTQEFHDLIEYVPATSGPNFQNVARARSDGVEAEVRVDGTWPVAVSTGVTLLRTRVLDAGAADTSATSYFRRGASLLRRPGVSYAVTAVLHGFTRVDGSLRWILVGRRDDLDYGTAQRATLPAVGTFDASARVDVLHRESGSARLVLHGTNLGNVIYENVRGFQTPGRVLMAGLELDR